MDANEIDAELKRIETLPLEERAAELERLEERLRRSLDDTG